MSGSRRGSQGSSDSSGGRVGYPTGQCPGLALAGALHSVCLSGTAAGSLLGVQDGSWMLGIEASLCGSRCSARATPGASLLWDGRVGPRALGRVLFPAAARVRAVGQLPRQRRSSRRPRRALLAQRLWPQPCCPCRREAIQRAMAGSVPGRWVGVGCSCLTARAPATTAPLDVTFWSSTASPRDY